MKLLVTGGSGMLGHDLLRRAEDRYELWGGYYSHPADLGGCRMLPLDLSDGRDLRKKLCSLRPAVIVHTAALTDVDECERQPERARSLNVEATKLLAELAQELNARMVYVSTDYVFDGARGDYREEDLPNPVNRYGETKLQGEEWVGRCCSRALIVRTTIYGLKLPPQRGLIETLVATLGRGQPLARFSDQYFTPLYTGQLSELIFGLLERDAHGLWHLGSREKLSRFKFTRRFADAFGLDGGVISPDSFRHIEGLARRPRDSSLVSGRLRQLAVDPPEVDAGLRRLREDWFSNQRTGAISS